MFNLSRSKVIAEVIDADKKLLKCATHLKADTHYEVALGTPSGERVSQNHLSLIVVPPATIEHAVPNIISINSSKNAAKVIKVTILGEFKSIKEHQHPDRFSFRIVNSKY